MIRPSSAVTNREMKMNVNQQVKGQYHGHEFSGVITQMRPLTVKTDGCFEYVIKLDNSITVYGHQRDVLCLYAKFDGSASSYTKYSQSMF